MLSKAKELFVFLPNAKIPKKCQFSAFFHSQILNLGKKISVRVLSEAKEILVLAMYKNPRKKGSIFGYLELSDREYTYIVLCIYVYLPCKSARQRYLFINLGHSYSSKFSKSCIWY